MVKAVIASAKYEVHKLASEIGGLGVLYEGAKADWRTAIYRVEAAAGRDSSNAERICDSL